MKNKLMLMTLVVFCLSCKNKIKNCTEKYIEDKKSLIDTFVSNHKSDLTESELLSFKADLESFIETHPDQKCMIGKKSENIHSEVRLMIDTVTSSLSSSQRYQRQSLMRTKGVYGDDDRVDTDDSTNEDYKKLAKGVAAQIRKNRIGPLGELLGSTLKEKANLCDGQRFGDQLSIANCSGFLVDDDLLVTAGHCMESQNDCDDFSWVFDFKKNMTSVDSSQVYGCKEIVSQVLDDETGLDYAVIKLSRKVSDREPLRFRLQGEIALNTPLVVIGHPSGLPQKIADNAKVRKNNNKRYFVANLDTFGGNSGSPVFNTQTLEVEGILVRGDVDYVFSDDGSGCRVVFECSNDGCGGESVTRITKVEGVPEYQVLPSLQAFNAIYEGEQKKNEGFLLNHGLREHYKYAVGGARFLNQCLVHTYKKDAPQVWLEDSHYDCSDKDSFSVVYNEFLRLIQL